MSPDGASGRPGPQPGSSSFHVAMEAILSVLFDPSIVGSGRMVPRQVPDDSVDRGLAMQAGNARYRQAKDLPETVPVFPLSGALLLPGGRMPLNIFEPRYLEMIDHVVAHERLIGMIQPRLDGAMRADAAISFPSREFAGSAPFRSFLRKHLSGSAASQASSAIWTPKPAHPRSTGQHCSRLFGLISRPMSSMPIGKASAALRMPRWSTPCR